MQARTAEQIFKVLGELKGGAMKFGQAMSIFEAAMPEEVAGPYRATLTRLQDSAPPMPASVVHKVLADELGPGWRHQFRLRRHPRRGRLDRPGAPGRVARRPRGGGQGAVPGAGKALISDLTQLPVGPAFGRLIPGLDIKPIMAELEQRVAEELDYGLEAEAQRHSRRPSRTTRDFAIPQAVAPAATSWSRSGSTACRCPRSSPTAPGAATRAAQRYLGSSSSARRGPVCCTPTRTPATSACWPTAAGIIDFGVDRTKRGADRPCPNRVTDYAWHGAARAIAFGRM